MPSTLGPAGCLEAARMGIPYVRQLCATRDSLESTVPLRALAVHQISPSSNLFGRFVIENWHISLGKLFFECLQFQPGAFLLHALGSPCPRGTAPPRVDPQRRICCQEHF